MDERETTLQKLLDLLFGDEDVEVDVIALIPEYGEPTPRAEARSRDQYHAYLLGLEGETVMEMEVRGDQWRDMRPPRIINVAYTKPPSRIRWQADPSKPVCFDTIVFEFHETCDMGCCAWYYRITPAFEDENK